MTERQYDLVVVGAGPAGMAAALQGQKLGLKTCVLDEQPGLGGQIHRGVDRNLSKALRSDDPDVRRGAGLVTEFQACDIDYYPETIVWHLDPDGRMAVMRGDETEVIRYRHIILATGSIERPMPVPGWTLPGVMTAGAAQATLKSAGIVPSGRIALCGTGPLLYLAAAQLVDAGADVRILIDTQQPGRLRAALPALPAALTAPDYLLRGIPLLRAPANAGVEVVRSVSEVRIDGEDKVQSVSWSAGGKTRTEDIDWVLLHQGVVPNINLQQAAGCDITWNERQHCWQPVLDDWGVTSQPRISVAGDSGGILGGEAAQHLGAIAALGAAVKLECLTPAAAIQKATPAHRSLRRLKAIRPFLDILYMPGREYRMAGQDTLACRCEEVTGGEVRSAIQSGCAGIYQIKMYTRCGMGPCQGRMCGLTIAEMVADETGKPFSEVGEFRQRTPVKPVPLTALAKLPDAFSDMEIGDQVSEKPATAEKVA